jgi:HEAT repeat protein
MAATVSRALDQLVTDLAAGGTPTDADLALFSDLDRPAADWLRERWLEMPVACRAALLARATELAEDNVELHFVQLGKIGLADPDPEVRESAVLSLWESDDRVVGDRLVDLLTADPAPGVRAAAAANLRRFVENAELSRLGRAEGERMVSALRHAFEDLSEPVEVRAAAIEALGPCGEPWVAGLIAAAYESEDRGMRISAVRAMGNSALERWVEYLSDQLDSDDEEFRLEAAVAAGSLGSEDLVPPLGELLADEDFDVVFAAIESLGEIGGEVASELLQDYRQSAPPELTEAVDIAIELAATGGLFRRFGEPGSD